MATIRPYRPQDRADVYDVCIATGHEGRDARGAYRQPEILPEIFAGPHLCFDQPLAFVLADAGRVVGYVLGTADTARHAREFRERWLPGVTGRFPPLGHPPGNLDEYMVELLHHPERKIREEIQAYPAHLHIDILPEYQGAGHGGRLIREFLAALAAAGAAGVHVSTLSANQAAVSFFGRVGFEPLAVTHPMLTYLGRAIS